MMLAPMLRRWLRRDDPRTEAIDTLYGRVNEASRAPALYEALGVPDTVEGRFEALCLHAILVLRRLGRLPPPAAEVAQDLVNAVFLHLDASLRESGIGDMGVPKRMKKLGRAFYGRASHYDAALDAGDERALAAALARNVLGADAPEAGVPLARYVSASDAELARLDLDAVLGAGPRFAAPDAFGAGRGAA